MPLFPVLINDIEIRERRKRYPGEPRYKRLSFIRDRSTNSNDVWDLTHTTRPEYYTQQQVPYQVDYPALMPGYPGPYMQQIQGPPQQGQLAWHGPQHQYHQQPPRQLEPHHGQQLQHYHHQQHPQGQVQAHYGHPTPPPHHHYHHPQGQIAGPEQIAKLANSDSSDDDNDIVSYVTLKPRKHVRPIIRMPSRSRSRPVRKQYRRVYDDDSDSDDGYTPRSRSRGRRMIENRSDDSLTDFYRRSRSRSRPRAAKGW